MKNKKSKIGYILLLGIILIVVGYNVSKGSNAGTSTRISTNNSNSTSEKRPIYNTNVGSSNFDAQNFDKFIVTDENPPEKQALEADLRGILKGYDVSYIDILTSVDGEYTALIGIESDIESHLGELVYKGVESKIKTIINDYMILITQDGKIIAS